MVSRSFLPSKDKARLMAHDEDHLCHDVEKLLRKTFALTSLVNVKVKDWKRAKDQRIKEDMEHHQEVERLQVEVNCLGGLQQEVERLQTEANRLDVDLANKTQEGLSLSEERSKISNEIEDLKKELIRKEKDFTMATNSFKKDVAQFYLVGFKDALERATIINSTIDFLELDSGKTVIDGKLVGDS